MADMNENDTDVAAQLEQLAHKLGIDDGSTKVMEEHKGSSRKRGKKMELTASPAHVHTGPYVLLLIDVHSHPVSLCHVHVVGDAKLL